MPLHITSPEVEKLLEAVVQMTGESPAEALSIALAERQQRLSLRTTAPKRAMDLRTFLQHEVWPQVPESARGVRLTKEEEEAILGYTENGV